MKKEFILKKAYFSILFLGMVVFFGGCGSDDSGPKFTADFGYDFIDANHVRFKNQTTGDYFLLDWDFGNGETAKNSSQTRTYDMFYPQAGTYTVTLVVNDFKDNVQTVSKDIVITETDMVISFDATVDASNPNKINLVNTSVGQFDSFKWIYRHKEVENETNTVAYFPYKGTYEIELQMIRGAETFSSKKTVNISSDDADYISSFTMTWSDEFDGSSVNTGDWAFETGSHGWGNNELQNYTNGSNAEVKNGNLVITARKVNDSMIPGSYTSTRMITRGKQEFTYGRMEIRAKLPSGRGIWPAIWMLGGNIGTVGWPACGEIDIMEYVGYEPNTVHATVHTNAGFGGNGDGSKKILDTAEEAFHVYGLIWTEKEMIFYTDSPENVTHRYAPAYKSDDNWPFDKPQFFIFNIAVGGSWGGAQGIDNSIFPQTMEIDYVRVYQAPE